MATLSEEISESMASDEWKNMLSDMMQNDGPLNDLIRTVAAIEGKSIDLVDFKNRNMRMLVDDADNMDGRDLTYNMLNNLSNSLGKTRQDS